MGQALSFCVHCEDKRGCSTCAELHEWIMEHLDAVPVVHKKGIRSSIITAKDTDEWQDRIILADESTQVCAVYYADDSERVPVVHAKWEEVESNVIRCSACQEKWSIRDDGDFVIIEAKTDLKRCPTCGAKMDAE